MKGTVPSFNLGMNSVFCLSKKLVDLDTDLIRFSYLKLLAYRPAFSEYCLTVKARTRILEDEWMDDAGPTADSWNTLFPENCATRSVRAACNVVWAFNLNIMGDAWSYGEYCRSWLSV